MLLKPVKTAFMIWLHENDSISRAAIFLALSGIPYKHNNNNFGRVEQCYVFDPGVISMFFCNKLYLIGWLNNVKLRHIRGAANKCEKGSCRGLGIVMDVSIFGSRCHRVFSVKEELYMF